MFNSGPGNVTVAGIWAGYFIERSAAKKTEKKGEMPNLNKSLWIVFKYIYVYYIYIYIYRLVWL